MRFSSVLFLSGCLSAQAALAPSCKNCNQDGCMDSIVQEDCGDYLIVVETPATETIFETAYATAVPTEVSYVTISTTVLNNITTTIPVFASATIDYTVTLTESETTTTTVLETQTVTETGSITTVVYKRGNEDEEEYDIPDYALACTDIYQYSSACSCVGFIPRTITAPVPETTDTVTVTVTPSTDIVVSTIQGNTVTRNATTIPVTTTVSTISISKAVETVTSITVVATDTTTVTETTFTTVIPTPTVPLPAPTETINLSAGDNLFLDGIRVPPGAQIGVIASIRETTTPATLIVDGGDGSVDVRLDFPEPKYSLYYYASNVAFSYIQITTPTVANILGVRKVNCHLTPSDEFTCLYDGGPSELWLCGRNLAIVKTGSSQAFVSQCPTAGVRRLTLTGIRV